MILARHAEALFWAGRQLERTEHTTRVFDIASRASMHHRPGEAEHEWLRVLATLGLGTAFDETSIEPNAATVGEFVFSDPSNTGSVVAAAGQLRDNIRIVRDRVPVELWEESNRLHMLLGDPTEVAKLETQPFELFSEVRRSCQTLTGAIAETMPRDEGHSFLRVGRMIERTSMLCRLIRLAVLAEDASDDPAVVLRMTATLQGYRRHHGYNDHPITVAMFLLVARDSPRSVLSCLRQAEEVLAALADTAPGLQPARRLAGRLRSDLEFDPLELQLAQEGPDRMLKLEVDLAVLADTITLNAFDPAHSSVLTTQFVRPGTGRERGGAAEALR